MNFHFISPGWLWGLFPLLGLIVFASRQRSNSKKWLAICDEHLLSHVMQGERSAAAQWPWFVLGLAWFIGVIALAGPTWHKRAEPVFHSTAATVIALDMSPSMLATDVKPNRAARAKYKAEDILRTSGDGQVGMVAFTSAPFVVSPLTQDQATIAAMMPELSPEMMPVGGSNIGKALQKAAALIRQGGQTHGRIIVISDSEANAADNAVASQLAKTGITTSVLSIGTAKGAPISTRAGFLKDNRGNIIIEKAHTQSLAALAKSGQGHFSPFTATDTDVKILSHMSAKQRLMQAGEKAMKVRSQVWRNEGHWFVLLLLPLMLCVFRRPWLSEICE